MEFILPKKNKKKNKHKSKTPYYISYTIDTVNPTQIRALANEVFGDFYYIDYQRLTNS